jgi:hypothetical protein
MAPTGRLREPDTHVRFPAASFVSYAEFLAYSAESRALFESRQLHERALALPPGAHVRPGTCAPCLRQARFSVTTEGGAQLPNGMVAPNWRDQLICDCRDRLGGRHRALLHFVETAITLSAWHRVLAFGRMSAAETRLCARLGETSAVPRLTSDAAGAHRIAAADASHHLAISLDYLHKVPSLPLALAELRRVLVPGGALVFTVPFRWDRPTTRSHVDLAARETLPVESGREIHEIGWDILGLLRAAGFARCRAHIYWSDELGYLGAYNTIFSAET